MAKRADRKGNAWSWKTVRVWAYGQERTFQVLSFQATWPKVFGTRTIQVVVSRSSEKGFGEVYLYTTDLDADAARVVETYASRTGIEGAFKDSKQVMEIQKPQHWCQASIEKLAPWVWLMQTTVALWYLTEGRKIARSAGGAGGNWARGKRNGLSGTCFRLLRRVTLRATIDRTSTTKADLHQLLERLENYLYLAA